MFNLNDNIMTLVKFRQRPWENLFTSDLLDFDAGNLFNDKLWLKRMNEPALNIKEKKDGFEIELAADGCLNIMAKKSEKKEEKEENYTRKEFSFNSFEKSLQLPETVIDEKIKAKYENGILKFSLAKKEEVKKQKPKMIEIL